MQRNPIDVALVARARLVGGQPAVQQIERLRRDLRVWHNGKGSRVREDEKGYFWGAYNAWYRCGHPRSGEAFDMMVVEAANINRIFAMMDAEVGSPITPAQMSSLSSYRLVPNLDGFGAAERQDAVEQYTEETETGVITGAEET